MKKIGTLTFHRAHNYGAVLQAYALQRVLLDEGYSSEIIDYRNRQIEDWFHLASAKSKLRYLYELVCYYPVFRAKRSKEKKFDSFVKDKMKLSRAIYPGDVFGDDYSAIVVGSDQIWNLDMTRKDYAYFLPYEKGAAKLAYAASFGVSRLKDEYLESVKKYLASFLSISVREEAGVQIVRDLLPDASVRKDTDPTLLLTREAWTSIEQPYEGVKPGNYVLMYFVAHQTESIALAKKIAEENDLELICISKSRKKREDIRQLVDVGPEEFIWLIHNAKCVVTTSYHGLVFSLNLNTPFLFELNRSKENKNSRLIEIRDRFSLDAYQIVSSDAQAYSGLTYEWDRINRGLDAMRNASKNSLFALLGSV